MKNIEPQFAIAIGIRAQFNGHETDCYSVKYNGQDSVELCIHNSPIYTYVTIKANGAAIVSTNGAAIKNEPHSTIENPTIETVCAMVREQWVTCS